MHIFRKSILLLRRCIVPIYNLVVPDKDSVISTQQPAVPAQAETHQSYSLFTRRTLSLLRQVLSLPRRPESIILTSLSVLLSSCAFFYNSPEIITPPAYVKPVAIESGFNISGRFIIKTANKNNSGNFTWDKDMESETLEFRTPLGQTVARIIVNESGVATLYTQTESYTGDDLTDELEDDFGFVLPINSLHYWVQGVAIPTESTPQTLKDGFVQSGWSVEYLDWQTPTHPHILRCVNGNYEIKLLIDWL